MDWYMYFGVLGGAACQAYEMKLEQIGNIQRISDEVRVWAASCERSCEVRRLGFRVQGEGQSPNSGRAVGSLQVAKIQRFVECFCS